MRRAVVLVLFAAPLVARADGPHTRVVGLGTGAGGGFAAVTLTSPTGQVMRTGSALTAALMLPTLEAQVFLNKREWSIDVTVPLTNTLVLAATVGGLFFNMDAFFNFNLGGDVVRFVIGPGVGFGVVSYAGISGASLRVPIEAGIELLAFRRNFGLKLLARPWLEISSGTAQTVGGGLIGLLGISGYITR
jgi:hypothetical protein